MLILADAANNGNKITVIILCIAAIVFLLVDAFLVISLHKHNSKLFRKDETSDLKELPAPESLFAANELPAPAEIPTPDEISSEKDGQDENSDEN